MILSDSVWLTNQKRVEGLPGCCCDTNWGFLAERSSEWPKTSKHLHPGGFTQLFLLTRQIQLIQTTINQVHVYSFPRIYIYSVFVYSLDGPSLTWHITGLLWFCLHAWPHKQSLQKRTSIIIRPSGEVRTELLAPLTFPCFLYHPRLLSNTPLCRRRSPSCSRSGILHLY